MGGAPHPQDTIDECDKGGDNDALLAGETVVSVCSQLTRLSDLLRTKSPDISPTTHPLQLMPTHAGGRST